MRLLMFVVGVCVLFPIKLQNSLSCNAGHFFDDIL